METTTNTSRRTMISLALIVIAALALRVTLAFLPRVIRWDEPDYLWLGANLWRGSGYTITGVPELHYTPLLPILSGAAYLLTGSAEWGTNVWFILLGTLLILPVFGLARRLYGAKVALISAVLVALYPALSSSILYWGTMTEPLYLVLIYGAAWMISQALVRDSWWRFALCGALMSLAYLARPEGLIWFLGYAVLIVFVWLFRKKLLRWRSFLHLVAYVVGALVIAAPYLLFIHGHTGRWMPTGKLAITYDIGEAVLEDDPALYDKVTASLDPDTGEILWWSENRFRRSMIDIIMDDPAAFAERTLRNLEVAGKEVLAWQVLPMFLGIFVLLGWFKRPWSGQRLTDEAILAFTAAPVLSFLPFHVEVRFFAPVIPAVLIWVASGAVAWSDWCANTVGACWQKGWPRRANVVRPLGLLMLVAALLVSMGLVHLDVVHAGLSSLNVGHKEAGLWLRKNAPANAAIMSRDLAISLYAERDHVVSPRAPYSEYLDYARRKGAHYLVVDERELRILRPHLAFLLDAQDPPDELECVYQTIDGHGRTLVYRIKDVSDDN